MTPTPMVANGVVLGVDRLHRTKGMTGFTLYPGKAYLEIKVRLFNRTPLPQTFLWWANPAVHVNDVINPFFHLM